MSVTAITGIDTFRRIIHSGKPILIDFWATWCGPCRQISPVFEKMSNNAAYAGAEFYKVDVDEESDIAQEAGIKAMPTFILFKNGKKEDELVGANPSKLELLVRQATSFL